MGHGAAWIAAVALGSTSCYESAPPENDDVADAAPEETDTADGFPESPPDNDAGGFPDLPADEGTDGPPDGTVTCDERTTPEPPQIRFYVDDGTRRTTDLYAACLVQTVVNTPDTSTVTLLCGLGGPIETRRISIGETRRGWPGVFLSPGEEVRLRYVAVVAAGWVEEWLSIRTVAGDLRLLVVQATDVAPPGTPREEWLAPVALRVLDGVCTPTVYPCGTAERLALEVSVDGFTSVVFDGSEGHVGSAAPYFLLVQLAVRISATLCPELYDAWYALVLVHPPDEG